LPKSSRGSVLTGSLLVLIGIIETPVSLLLDTLWLPYDLHRLKKDKIVPVLKDGIKYQAALYNLGLNYKDKGDIRKATAAFEQLSHIKSKPGEDYYDARAFEQLGLIYKDLGDYKIARQNFLKAIGIYKDSINQDKIYDYLSDEVVKIEKILQELPQN
jgi:tetratricopeptide (TPR) repeat protein